jgi:hypothetical protein
LQDGSGGVQYFGDIFPNFQAGLLDNLIFSDAIDGQTLTPPDDVSMAMGWDFNLAADESALVTFLLSDTLPSGFHLVHSDPDSRESLYLSSTLRIQGQGIPVPPTFVLIAAGLIALARARSRRGS